MRVGLFTDAFPEWSLEEVLEWLAARLPSVRDLELGTGGYSAAPHIENVARLGGDFRLAALLVLSWSS